MRPIRTCSILLLSLGAVTCAVVVPASGQRPFPPDSFINLKVLPKDIPRGELITLMASFTRALGVRCTFCHVGAENLPLDAYDFPSDEKPTKRKARAMLRMVQAINDQHLSGLEQRVDPPVRVQCFTCHHGVREPRPLQEILLTTYRAAGLDSTVAAYRALRARYYGSAAYDFGEVALADVAGGVARMDRFPDALRLLELNVELNPASVFAQRQYAQRALEGAFVERGAEAGAALYRELKARYRAEALAEETLNTVGYALLQRAHAREAVAAFKLNVELYPDSWNTYDSLGEGYLAAGDTVRAIANYERSVALNPQNAGGRRRLQELRARKR